MSISEYIVVSMYDVEVGISRRNYVQW